MASTTRNARLSFSPIIRSPIRAGDRRPWRYSFTNQRNSVSFSVFQSIVHRLEIFIRQDDTLFHFAISRQYTYGREMEPKRVNYLCYPLSTVKLPVTRLVGSVKTMLNETETQ